ncbi:hypothetical protein VTL71DRAFT_9411 [Oculimacula yallundae]|uniref:Sm domain-containing protein n=1 Tax=Oculimacula yallundae TaxID=86028 RepID=A0ABR4BUN3_9HELO
MDKTSAENYLSSLLNKTLRVTTTDTRMFLGQFKCTDSDLNIILSSAYEYRLPPPPKSTSASTPVTQDLTSRYLGLVVVPGEYITRIEVEEFTSQMKGLKSVRVGSEDRVKEAKMVGGAE